MRITVGTKNLPLVERGTPFNIFVDGEQITAYPGETIATVLFASGRRVFHQSENGSPRSLYCGIGQCFSCLVTVDDKSDVRACVTLVKAGMKIKTISKGVS